MKFPALDQKLASFIAVHLLLQCSRINLTRASVSFSDHGLDAGGLKGSLDLNSLLPLNSPLLYFFLGGIMPVGVVLQALFDPIHTGVPGEASLGVLGIAAIAPEFAGGTPGNPSSKYFFLLKRPTAQVTGARRWSCCKNEEQQTIHIEK